MTLGQEKLDIYRLSVGYVAWVFEKTERQTGKVELDGMATMLSRLAGRG